MKPMLAFKWNDKSHLMPFPAHIQPKLNGVRMLYMDGSMQSRSYGKDTELLWSNRRLVKIRSTLASWPNNFWLDGEIYKHGWSLQKINGAASINRLDDNDSTDLLEYHIFDCFLPDAPLMSFDERHEYLHEMRFLLGQTDTVRLVHTVNVLTAELAEPFYGTWRHAGYEGMMYRKSSSPYGHSSRCTNQENRWPCLLKRKDWCDDEFECEDFVTTKGAKGERGFQLTCQLDNGATFNIGSGLSDIEVDKFALEPPIGRLIKVKYETLSDGGVPLKPTILDVL